MTLILIKLFVISCPYHFSFFKKQNALKYSVEGSNTCVKVKPVRLYINKQSGETKLLRLKSVFFLNPIAKFNDVPIAGAADRAEEADQRCGGSFEETRSSFRDCLLQEQGPFLALWRVSSLKPYRFSLQFSDFLLLFDGFYAFKTVQL